MRHRKAETILVAIMLFLIGTLAGYFVHLMASPTKLDHCVTEDQKTPCYWDSQRVDPMDAGDDFIVVDETTSIYTELSGKDSVKVAGKTYEFK